MRPVGGDRADRVVEVASIALSSLLVKRGVEAGRRQLGGVGRLEVGRVKWREGGVTGGGVEGGKE